jgi:hypothetical protein
VARLTLNYASSPLLFWVLGSVLVYALTTNLLWLTRSLGFWRSPYSRWLVQAGRFLFHLGLSLDWPITRWLQAVGTALGVGLVALLIMALAWVNANRQADGSRLRFPPRAWWALLVDGLFLQGHWAFYRGALAVEFEDLYLGVFAGLALIYLEWGANPFWRRGWRSSSLVAGQWLRASLALLAAIVFLLTRNLWLCLGLHWLLEITFWRLGQDRAASVPELTQFDML